MRRGIWVERASTATFYANIILLRLMVWNLKAKIIEIETTFLHCDLVARIFMEIPSGMEVINGKCYFLKKIIYGLMQSARNFYVKLVKTMKSCRFTGSLVDLYLWVQLLNTRIVMMLIYVENCLNIDLMRVSWKSLKI
jgi:hypothetical protein